MADIGTILEQAISHHQSGEVQAAEPLYRQVLESHPDHWDTLYLLGTALLQSGRFDECISLLSRVVEARPDVPDAHNNLGVAYKALEKWEESAKAFQAAVRANPEYDQALYNLGALMQQRGLFADAEKCYRHTLQLIPQDMPTRTALGDTLKSQEKWPQAEELYREVLASGSQDLDLHVNFAFVLARQEKLDEAGGVYREILDAKPEYYQVHNSLSYVYERQGKLQAAVDAAEKALEIQPDYAEGYNNLGTALKSLHRFDEAISAFEKSISLADDFPLAEFNLGTTKLLLGQFREGWPGYERRSETMESPPRTFSQSRWNGETVSGQTLLVHSDQGFGDAIQFARFLPEVARRSGAKLLLECQPELKQLFSDHPSVDEVIAEGNPLPQFDAQIPLTSLPALFDVEPETIPADIPYLTSAGSLREDLLSLLEGASSGEFKVGFVWQGNPQQARDIVRSCAVEEFRPLFETEGIAPFSLQTGAAAERLQSLDSARKPVDLGSQLRNFAETAGVISKLDLVISVDTATAHLAGALGVPAWTLLCHTPDWRWLLDRDDSPWYPSMRLFRQPAWGDWETVIEQVVSRLEKGTGVFDLDDRRWENAKNDPRPL